MRTISSSSFYLLLFIYLLTQLLSVKYKVLPFPQRQAFLKELEAQKSLPTLCNSNNEDCLGAGSEVLYTEGKINGLIKTKVKFGKQVFFYPEGCAYTV